MRFKFRACAWQALHDVAASQEGLFTTRQAMAAGYSPPLLSHHQKAGRITRIRRGVYRLVHFPPGEHEELRTSHQATVCSCVGYLTVGLHRIRRIFAH